MTTSAPPGWYPIGPDRVGYWDGAAWTWLPPPQVPRSPIGEPVRDDPPLASLRGCLVGGIAAVALSVVAYLLLRDTRLEDWKLLVVAFAAVWTGLGVGCWIALRENRRSLVDSLQLPRTPRGWLRAVLIGIGIGVAMRIGSGIVALPFVPFLDDDTFPFGVAQALRFVRPSDSFLLTFGVGAVVGAPLVEEMFFRNVVQSTMVRRWPLRVAIVGQAVVFSLAHVSLGAAAAENLMTVTIIAAVGVGFGMLRSWSGTLVTCIVAHATFNAIAVAAVYALPWLTDAGLA